MAWYIDSTLVENSLEFDSEHRNCDNYVLSELVRFYFSPASKIDVLPYDLLKGTPLLKKAMHEHHTKVIKEMGY